MRCSLNTGLVHISKHITLHTIFGVWMSLLLPTCVNLLASLGITAFPWLCFEEGKMFCMICTSQDGTTGQFVDDSTSFHTHSLTKHAERYMYTGSCVPYIMPMLSKNCSSQHKSCMHTLSGHTSRAEQSVMSRLAVLFRHAHAIAKAGRPFSDMEWMCALDEKKGLDVGALYRTDKKCCESILQKSSGWVCNKSFSQTTSSLSWWMAPLTHLLVMQKLSI